jgi:hypothetical protein
MSSAGRKRSTPSTKYTSNIHIKLLPKHKIRLDQLCADLDLTYSEYFRDRLLKDKRYGQQP